MAFNFQSYRPLRAIRSRGGKDRYMAAYVAARNGDGETVKHLAAGMFGVVKPAPAKRKTMFGVPYGRPR